MSLVYRLITAPFHVEGNGYALVHCLPFPTIHGWVLRLGLAACVPRGLLGCCMLRVLAVGCVGRWCRLVRVVLRGRRASLATPLRARGRTGSRVVVAWR